MQRVSIKCLRLIGPKLLKFIEIRWKTLVRNFQKFQIMTASGSSHHINLSLFSCLFLKLWNLLKLNRIKVEFPSHRTSNERAKITVDENDRYRKITVIHSLNWENCWRSQSNWFEKVSTDYILDTVCPITSGVAQRKRVGLITQRSKDRNLPPLYQSQAWTSQWETFFGPLQ